MRKTAIVLSFLTIVLAGCAAPGETDGSGPSVAEETANRERQLVENAVRDAYEAEGAAVTDVTMELSPDGSRYTGRATVRDPASGAELTVDCRYTTDAGGSPRLNCDRVQNYD